MADLVPKHFLVAGVPAAYGDFAFPVVAGGLRQFQHEFELQIQTDPPELPLHFLA
jgi:hypothetical protein